MSSVDPTWLTSCKAELAKKAEHLITKEFPQKIDQLTELMKSELFSADQQQPTKRGNSTDNLDDKESTTDQVRSSSDESEQSRKRTASVLYNGCYHCTSGPERDVSIVKSPCDCGRRQTIIEMTSTASNVIVQFQAHISVINRWIALLVPEIAFGDNFGVSVQYTALFTSMSVEYDAKTALLKLEDYFPTRASYVIDAKKCPNMEDAWVAITEWDNQHALFLSRLLRTIRDGYATILDHLLKNSDKIKKPRSDKESYLTYN